MMIWWNLSCLHAEFSANHSLVLISSQKIASFKTLPSSVKTFLPGWGWLKYCAVVQFEGGKRNIFRLNLEILVECFLHISVDWSWAVAGIPFPRTWTACGVVIILVTRQFRLLLPHLPACLPAPDPLIPFTCLGRFDSWERRGTGLEVVPKNFKVCICRWSLHHSFCLPPIWIAYQAALYHNAKARATRVHFQATNDRCLRGTWTDNCNMYAA